MNKREKAYNLTGGKCFYCGCDLDFNNFHLDHYFPKTNGGKYKDNTVPACIECNILKCDKSVEEFRKSINEEFRKNIHVRLVSKYYDIKPKKIKFFYEKHRISPI